MQFNNNYWSFWFFAQHTKFKFLKLLVFFPRKLICPWRCCQFGLLTMQSRMQSVVRNMIMMMVVRYMIMMMMVRYMRKDGTLRFGDFVAIILNLTVAFCKFAFYFVLRTSTTTNTSHSVSHLQTMFCGLQVFRHITFDHPCPALLLILTYPC